MRMQRALRLSAVTMLATGLLAGCDDDGVGIEEQTFTATLTGDAEVPARTTAATGTATFDVDEDGTVSWTITATNITNVTAAHIHGPASTDANADILVPLFTGALEAGARSGTFTSANIEDLTLAALLLLMASGQTYVNVHTDDGEAPENTGPGDFAAGEIRGQIELQ